MRKSNQLAVFLLLILLYICLVFLLPTDPATLQKYNITQTQAYLLSLTVVVPIVAVWMSAFYGYSVFRRYAEAIGDSTDGRALYKLARGLMVLAFSLPVLACVGSLFNYVANNAPEFLGSAVLLRQIAIVGFPLYAFILISDAAEELMHQTRRRKNFLQNQKVIALIIIVGASVFTWATLSLASDGASPKQIYAYPAWIILTLTVIPHLYMWYRGLTAVYGISFYSKHVRGHVYKKSFNYLAWGLGLVILLAIILQILSTLNPQLQRLNFTPILLIVYALIALYALGYGMIAAGAKKLSKIEEV